MPISWTEVGLFRWTASYLGLNAEYLPPTGASGNYLPGGPKNYSTQKVITYSDSTRKTVQENVFCLYGTILNLVTKVAQTLPKSDQFMFNMQTGKCHPYVQGVPKKRGLVKMSNTHKSQLFLKNLNVVRKKYFNYSQVNKC